MSTKTWYFSLHAEMYYVITKSYLYFCISGLNRIENILNLMAKMTKIPKMTTNPNRNDKNYCIRVILFIKIKQSLPCT